MEIVDCQEWENDNCNRVRFIRVEITDLRQTIFDIISDLNDLSWINKFEQEYKRESFLARAKTTADALSYQIQQEQADTVTEDTGEYIVSEASRLSIVKQWNYLSIPLAELLGRKLTGNPGFDFFTVNENDIIIFGEAKYSTSNNAYGRAFRQVDEFIDLKKDIADLKLIDDFCDEQALNNVIRNIKGFAIGFSSKKIATEDLVKNIKANTHYTKLSYYPEIIIVAVNI